MTAGRPLLERLRNAGISPTDSEELRLQKSLLFFATGLISLASMVWLSIYWQLGPRFSSNLPFALQLLLVGNLLVYLKTLNFNVFRLIQLSLFLFTPFVAQWSIGGFITASGISLWALLAPIGALLFIGTRESGAWFFAYVFLTMLSGGFDYCRQNVDPDGEEGQNLHLAKARSISLCSCRFLVMCPEFARGAACLLFFIGRFFF